MRPSSSSVEPETWSRSAPLVRGHIIERCRCEGKAVKKGDLLARLDDKEAIATLNDLRALDKWKIIDNLRRSTVELAQLALLVGGWLLLPGSPIRWTLLGLGAIAARITAVAQADVEPAPVNRLDLPGPLVRSGRARFAGEAGHAG